MCVLTNAVLNRGMHLDSHPACPLEMLTFTFNQLNLFNHLIGQKFRLYSLRTRRGIQFGKDKYCHIDYASVLALAIPHCPCVHEFTHSAQCKLKESLSILFSNALITQLCRCTALVLVLTVGSMCRNLMLCKALWQTQGWIRDMQSQLCSMRKAV